MKKILIYNWPHVDDMIGGGVSLYIQNLINALIGSGEYKVVFLNSGWNYDNKKKPYIKRIDNKFNQKLDCYELMNSPVIAPIEQSAKNLKMYLNDRSMLPIISDFIESQNGFDIIHFNNLEGLSIDVLRLKERYPDTKLIYSMHNYFPFCSKVNLWQDAMTDHPHNCNKKSYEECVTCYKSRAYPTTIFRRRNPTIGRRILSRIVNMVYRDNGDADVYRSFTESNVVMINRYIDHVLAVSKRVAEIAVGYGLDREKVSVSYIGTKVAEKAQYRSNSGRDDGTFRLIFMGYMRSDKGYYFLTDCLEKIPDEYANRIEVVIAARYDGKNNSSEIAQLDRLRKRYRDVELINGYTPENQEEMLRGVDLGVVPVLWEDNLPQIAIEQIAYGVPIIVSDLGGARELVNDERFIFKAGDHEDFIKKLIHIIDHPEYLEGYWNSVMRLRTLEDHFKEIREYYK